MKPLKLLPLAALLAPPPAFAQALEEVLVTAQKREESLQDVPLSVTALSGRQMDALGISDFADVTQQMPSAQLNAWSPKLTVFNLRGVSQNNFTDNFEAPVAVYVDDAYKASMNSLSGQLFDMERVEVLRGPQGTLFGRNATGGLIHYISKGADEAETNGYAEVEFGDYARQAVEGAIGGSLGDSARFRIAGRWNEQDGYIEGADTLHPSGDPEQTIPGSGQDIGGLNGYAWRGNLQVDFSDTLQGSFWLKYDEDEDVPTGGYVFEDCDFVSRTDCAQDEFGRAVTNGQVEDLYERPASPHTNYGDHEGFLNREKFDVTARFDADAGNGLQLASITNYHEMENEYSEDGDAFALPILTFQTFVPDFTQFSQELRLSGESDAVRWQTGFYYLNLDMDAGTSVFGAPGYNQVVRSGRLAAAGGNPESLKRDVAATDDNDTRDALIADDDPDNDPPFPGNSFYSARNTQTYQLESTNWSVFGQLDWDLSERTTLTAGLRWSQDDKGIDWQLEFMDDFNKEPVLIETEEGFKNPTLDPSPDPTRNVAVPDADEIDYGDWAGRLALSVQFSDGVLGFASVNRGIKGGNWSTGGAPNIFSTTFKHDEEVLLAYEVGIKAEGATARFNATWFYYDYQDYQAFSLASFGPFIRNTDASAYGGEAELFWSPNEHWDFIFGGAYLSSEVDEVIGFAGVLNSDGSVRFDAAEQTGIANGKPITNAEFPNAPELNLNYLIRFNFNVGSGNIALQWDGAWYDDQYLEVTNGSGTVQEAYHVGNLRATYTTAEERFSLSGWVKNFTDEEYKLYSLDLGFLGATTYYAPPITYGLTARLSF